MSARWAGLAGLAVLACSGPAPPPAEEPAAPVEEPPPTPVEASLEADPVPDGPSCFSTAECEGEAHCRGPAGCEVDWACGAPRECGEESVAYCGCDMATFYAPEGCPGQPYVHAGPCDALGEEVEEPTDAVEGNRVCTSSRDCRRGFVCAGTEGCSTLWTCVRRRRMRPRCARREDHFCSCDGQTFEASATCPGEPFLRRGYCPGDEPPPEEPPLVAEADPTPEATPRPPATRPVAPVTPPPSATPAEPVACISNRDCPRGQVCWGNEACTSDWHCRPPPERCMRDTQYFCSCTGETFTAPMNCPGRPHRHRGSCSRE